MKSCCQASIGSVVFSETVLSGDFYNTAHTRNSNIYMAHQSKSEGVGELLWGLVKIIPTFFLCYIIRIQKIKSTKKDTKH